MPRISHNKCKCHPAERFPKTRKLSEACGELLPAPTSLQDHKRAWTTRRTNPVWLESSRVNERHVCDDSVNEWVSCLDLGGGRGGYSSM